MSNVTNNSQINLASFQQAIENPDNSSANLVIKDGKIESQGFFSSIFSSKSENRETIKLFIKLIEDKYGKNFADIYSNNLQSLAAQGKSLKASLVSDILSRVEDNSSGAEKANKSILTSFVSSKSMQFNLDAALQKFAKSNSVFKDALPRIKERLIDSLQSGKLPDQDKKVYTPKELYNLVVRGDFPHMDAMLKIEAGVMALKVKYPELSEQTINNMQESLTEHLKHDKITDKDKLMARTDLLYKMVSEGRLTCQSKFLASEGIVPAVDKKFIHSSGQQLDELTHVRSGSELFRHVPTEQLKDIVWLSNDITDATNHGFILDRLGEMRKIQPEGQLTMDTVWKACFNKDFPVELKNATAFKKTVAFDKEYTMLLKTKVKEQGGKITPLTEMEVKMAIMNGIKFETCLENLKNEKVKFTMQDISGKTSLYSLAEDNNIKEAKDQLKLDLLRIEPSTTDPNYREVITFHDKNGSSQSFTPMNTVGMTDQEVKNYTEGASFNQMFDSLVDKIKNYTNGNEKQTIAIIYGLSQGGLSLLPMASGFKMKEHSSADVNLEKMENGDIHINFKTPEGSPVEFFASFVVKPDGSNYLQDLNVEFENK